MFREVSNEDAVVVLLDDLLPRRNGLLAMIKAYLDRGSRADAEGVMCVAAALFKPPKYRQFVRDWERMLKGIKPGGVPYFHATDFFTGGGMFRGVSREVRNDVAAKLPDLIHEHVHQVIAVSFKEDEFNRVAPPTWRARF